MKADTSKLIRFVACLFCGIMFFAPVMGNASPNASVTVIRSDNAKPLLDAIVRIRPLTTSEKIKDSGGLTDAAGVYSFTVSEPVVLNISHLGFSTITDTLYKAEDKTYYIEPSAQNIQDIVVTGEYGPNNMQKAVYEIRVINQETLKAKGANNLRDALQNELGIDLGQDQVFGSSLSINGISGEGVKIMVDGVPISGRTDGKLDLSQININNIDRIEIVEGPLSVLYGTDAMGGVVNVITKNFQAEKINLNLKGYYETVGQYNVELSTGFAFKKNQIYLSVGRYFFDGYSASDTLLRFKEWKPKEQYFADAKYIYTGNRFRFSLTGSFFRELMLNRSAPMRTLSYDNNDTSWIYTGEDVHFLTYRPRAAASLMYKFKEDYQLDALLSYSGFYRFANTFTKNLVTQSENLVANADAQDTSVYHQVLFRTTYSMPAWKRKINFQIGAEVNQEYTVQDRIENSKKQSGDYAAFGSVKFTLLKGLDVQPAMRFSYNTRFPAPLIPSLNIKYSHKDKLVFRASYGKGYRAPSLKELYLSFFDVNHSLRGNPDLKPENGHSVNVSVNYNQSVGKEHTIIYSASTFYNNIKDKIDWFIIPGIGINSDTFQYFNLKNYVTYGGEVSLGYRWKKLQLNTSAQFTRYELSRTNNSDKVKIFSPDFTASISYFIPKVEIGINIFYKFNGQKPLFSINNSIQTGKRNAYHSLDMSLTRSFWKNRIQITVGGKNLVGVKNVQADNVSSVGHNFSGNAVNIGWGTTFFTSLVLHFSK